MLIRTKYNRTKLGLLVCFIAITVAVLVAGCSHTSTLTSTSTAPFSGTRYSTYEEGSEKLILNADGSYKQFIQTKTHRTLTNSSRWTPGQAPANSSDTGPWFILHDYVTPWDWVKSKPNAPIQRSTLLISTEGFSGVTHTLPHVETANTSTPLYTAGTGSVRQKPRLSPGAYDAVLLLGIFFTILWVYAIVGAAQRGDTMWLIIIVLFGVCPAFIYAVTRGFGGGRRY